VRYSLRLWSSKRHGILPRLTRTANAYDLHPEPSGRTANVNSHTPSPMTKSSQSRAARVAPSKMTLRQLEHEIRPSIIAELKVRGIQALARNGKVEVPRQASWQERPRFQALSLRHFWMVLSHSFWWLYQTSIAHRGVENRCLAFGDVIGGMFDCIHCGAFGESVDNPQTLRIDFSNNCG
jgi:hypothetical protein